MSRPCGPRFRMSPRRMPGRKGLRRGELGVFLLGLYCPGYLFRGWSYRLIGPDMYRPEGRGC
jgi:hypothetical protein